MQFSVELPLDASCMRSKGAAAGEREERERGSRLREGTHAPVGAAGD